MCCMCDGWTLDEAQADLNDRKQRFGWALQGVEGARPWVYSIGLTERFGHPELVMAGVPFDAATAMINTLGHRIAAGEDFVDGDHLCEGEIELEVGAGGAGRRGRRQSSGRPRGVARRGGAERRRPCASRGAVVVSRA